MWSKPNTTLSLHPLTTPNSNRKNGKFPIKLILLSVAFPFVVENVVFMRKLRTDIWGKITIIVKINCAPESIRN